MAKKARPKTGSTKAKPAKRVSSPAKSAQKKKTAAGQVRAKKKKVAKVRPTKAKAKAKKPVAAKSKVVKKKAAKKKSVAVVKPKAAKKKKAAAKKKAVGKKAAQKKPRVATRRKLAQTKTKVKAKAKAAKKATRFLSTSAALKIFGQAVRLFYDHNFERARRAFIDFVDRFPEETEMVARARSYVAICDQRLSHPPTTPRNAEELYDRGILELNSGRILQAISLFEKALKYEPEAAYIHYSLAAAHARLGQLEPALKELKDAIQRREFLRIQARHDADFVNLYTNSEFQELVGWELVEEPTPFSQTSES